MTKYKIVRYFFNGGSETIKTGLTLEEAQAHCRDPETSSQTCTLPENKAITEKYGPWFDGYEEVNKTVKRSLMRDICAMQSENILNGTKCYKG